MTPQTLAHRFVRPLTVNGQTKIKNNKSISKGAVGAILLLLGAMVAQGCGSSLENDPSCVVGEVAYALGETVETDDDCNDCTCTEDGVMCTAMGCANGCEYFGVHYQQDETFTTNDGCALCTCLATGSVSCVDRDCGSACTYQGTPLIIGDIIGCDLPECNGWCECLDVDQLGCEQVGS